MSRARHGIVYALAAGLFLPACSTVDYYWQAIDGHFSLLREARPIEQILAEGNTPQALRDRLALAGRIREFASRDLGLPDNGSYKSYADIGRPYVVWNVFAAPADAVTPLESCFPFAGCVAYRGFFSEARALDYAKSVEDRGQDAYVGGVLAYSTLGWFSDPLLSTFVNFPEVELARIIFHELAHQVVYVRDDTQFNESFAVAVEEEGVRRWLATRGGLEGSVAFERYREAARRRDEFVRLMLDYRAQLQAAYSATQAPAQKRAIKMEMFQRFKQRYETLKSSWRVENVNAFDRFFARGPNNAALVSIALYADHVAAFRALLAQAHGDMPAFFAEVASLARLEKSERLPRLNTLRAIGR